jgi:hypothetical protein
MSTDKEDKVIGHIEIREIRDKYEPNYNVFILIDREIPKNKLGDFDDNEWNYAYLFKEEEIDIYNIEETSILPRPLDALMKAIKKLYPDEVAFSYVIKLWSKLKKLDVEWEVEHWLQDEGYRVKGIEVVKLPKVKKKKRIPITKSMFEKMLKKQVEKE